MSDKPPNNIYQIINRFKKELLFYSKELIDFDNKIIEIQLGKLNKDITQFEKEERINRLELQKLETIKAIIYVKNRLKTYKIKG